MPAVSSSPLPSTSMHNILHCLRVVSHYHPQALLPNAVKSSLEIYEVMDNYHDTDIYQDICQYYVQDVYQTEFLCRNIVLPYFDMIRNQLFLLLWLTLLFFLFCSELFFSENSTSMTKVNYDFIVVFSFPCIPLIRDFHNRTLSPLLFPVSVLADLLA